MKVEKIKEAVQTVKDSWDKHYIETDGSEQAEALEVLIKSAEAWEKIIYEIKNTYEDTDLIKASHILDVINKHLEEATKIGPHWIDLEDREEFYGPTYQCSVCGNVAIGTPNYCSNCGVKMNDEEVKPGVKKEGE